MFELYKKYLKTLIIIIFFLVLSPFFILLIIDGILIPLLDLIIAPLLLKAHKIFLGFVYILCSLFMFKLGYDLLKMAIKDLKNKMFIEFTIFFLIGIGIVGLNLFAWLGPSGLLSEGGMIQECFTGDPWIRRIYFWY